jgi:hypothetical protein
MVLCPLYLSLAVPQGADGKAPMKRSLIAVSVVLAFALSGCATSTTATKKDSPTSPTSAAATDDADTSSIPADEVSESPTPEGIPTGKVGDALQVTTDDSTGEITLQIVRVVQPGQYDSKAENGRYIQVVISAKSTSGTFSINPFDFALVDNEGQEYDQTYVTAKGPDLNARDLHVGQKAKGSIIYDAPKGALTLAYRGGGFSSEDVGVWTLGK